MSEHTTAKLARALAEIPGVPKDMIQRAVDGYYHDYLSPLAMPEIQLVSDLKAVAKTPATPRNSRPLLLAMAQRVVDGEFDASKEESDAWAASPEGQETFQQLVTDSRIQWNGQANTGGPVKPSVGRIVHYVSHGTPVQPDGSQAFTSQCRAAIVTEAGYPENDPQQPVGLCVLNPTGQFFNRAVPFDEGLSGGTWHWPERV